MSKKFSNRNINNLINAIMNPQCEECSDTGVITGPTFDSENPQTYYDFQFCKCDKSIEAFKEYMEESQNASNSG